MEALLGAIGTVGFPIVVCLLCGYFIYKVWQQQTTANHEREEKLYEQIGRFSAALDNFGNTLSVIDARLEVIETKVLEHENDSNQNSGQN